MLWNAFLQKLYVCQTFKNLENHLKWFLNDHLLNDSFKNHNFLKFYNTWHKDIVKAIILFISKY